MTRISSARLSARCRVAASATAKTRTPRTPLAAAASRTALTALSGSLDALGPAGIYAVDTLGDSLLLALFGVLAMWLVVPVLMAWRRFTRKSDL